MSDRRKHSNVVRAQRWTVGDDKYLMAKRYLAALELKAMGFGDEMRVSHAIVASGYPLPPGEIGGRQQKDTFSGLCGPCGPMRPYAEHDAVFLALAETCAELLVSENVACSNVILVSAGAEMSDLTSSIALLCSEPRASPLATGNPGALAALCWRARHGVFWMGGRRLALTLC